MNLDNMPCRNSTQCASGQTFYHRKLHLCDKNFLYKKLGRRRNVAPCKNCNHFFDVAPIMCDFPLKVNPCAKFDRINLLSVGESQKIPCYELAQIVFS